MPNFISEDQIEQALVQRLQHLHGFDSLNCYTDDPEDLNDGSHRVSKRDVILIDRVKEAALRLNPDIRQKLLMTLWKNSWTGAGRCRSSLQPRSLQRVKRWYSRGVRQRQGSKAAGACLPNRLQ